MFDGNMDVVEDLDIPGLEVPMWEQILIGFYFYTIPMVGKFFFLNLFLGAIQTAYTAVRNDPATRACPLPHKEISKGMVEAYMILLRLWPNDKYLLEILRSQETSDLRETEGVDPFSLSGVRRIGNRGVDEETADASRILLMGMRFSKTELTTLLNDMFGEQLQDSLQTTDRDTSNPNSLGKGCMSGLWRSAASKVFVFPLDF